MIWRPAPKLDGDHVTMTYEDGALAPNSGRIPAREL
jgi:hypothetical protein